MPICQSSIRQTASHQAKPAARPGPGTRRTRAAAHSMTHAAPPNVPHLAA
jgi:hypothetical protein